MWQRPFGTGKPEILTLWAFTESLSNFRGTILFCFLSFLAILYTWNLINWDELLLKEKKINSSNCSLNKDFYDIDLLWIYCPWTIRFAELDSKLKTINLTLQMNKHHCNWWTTYLIIKLQNMFLKFTSEALN